jgi:MFS family permease
VKPSFGRFVVDMSVNASVAGLGVLMLPMAVGALANHGMSASVLGFLAFMELGFAAATALLSGWMLRRANPISLCVLGGVLSAIGNLLSTLVVAHTAPLLLFRAIAGVGTGLMSAGGLALVARLPKAERMYGYIGMAPCLSALLGFWLAPYLIDWAHGAGGIFGFEAVLGACNGVLMYWRKARILEFVAYENSVQGTSTGLADSGAQSIDETLGAKGVASGAFGFGLISSFCLALCDASVWAFVAPVGGAAGIPLEKMGHVLIVCAIVGCGGPLLAARLGARFGFVAPIGIGQCLMIVLGVVMVFTGSASIYELALYARVFTILFLQPVYQGLYARVDPVGRVVAASFGAGNIGYSVGPLIAGQFISTQLQQFHNLAFLAAIAAVLGLVSTVPLFSRVNPAAAGGRLAAVNIAP